MTYSMVICLQHKLGIRVNTYNRCIGLHSSHCTFIFTRRRSWSFNDVHAFVYNSAGSERIWMKFGDRQVYCLELALTDFGRDPRISQSGRPCRNFVFFCKVNNARLCRFPVSQFSRNLHTKRDSERRWILLGNIFWKFAPNGSFFQKTVIIVNDFRLQAAISRKWL